VRRKPYSVILFDEIEKAHPEVFNTLLQLLDDGRLTDSQGRTVDFKNTVVIMTSNIGSSFLLDGMDETGEINEDVRRMVMGELRNRFRPEFLNRIDEIVMFHTLTKQYIAKIILLAVDEIRSRLAERNIGLILTGAAVSLITTEAYSPSYGARPIKRFLQKNLETRIGRMIVAGEVGDGMEITVDARGGDLVFESVKTE
jgi:ATP-dependent Clp protease ATP-binding subunit ClpB